MTKTAPEITLDSDRARAAEEARDTLHSLEARLPSIRDAALKGQVSAETLANWNDDIALARLRAEAAEQNAADERAALADPAAIAEAVDAFGADDALSTDLLIAATQAARAALDNLEKINASRNSAVLGWVTKLRDLGVPDNGLTVGDSEIRIQTSATTGTTIAIGSARTQAVRSIAPHIAHLTQPYTRGAAQRIDPATLTRLDSRNTEDTQTVAVRLLVPIGGKDAGDVLTSHTHAVGVLAQWVHAEKAELIEGTIPEPSEHQRTLFFGDTSLLPDPQRVTTIRNANDDAIVARAVAKAFEN